MLTEKIGNLIMPKPKRSRIRFNAKNSLEDETSNLPIIQRCANPIPVKPEIYKNAFSPQNPEGCLIALQEFSKLADNVPTFSRYYSRSNISIERTYSHLISGVTITPDSDYVRAMFSEAKENFEYNKYLKMGGGAPGYWHPVYAYPDDWYEPSGFTDLNFNLTSEEENNGRYRTIPTKSELGIPNELLDGSNQEKLKKVELDPDTKLKSINFKFKQVDLYRDDWLDFSIFGIGNWAVKGLKKGYYSSGTIEKNAGVMPLVTSSILLAMDVKIDAEYAGDDEKVIKENKNLLYGPFALNNKIQIFGWISSLVPLSPSSSI